MSSAWNQFHHASSHPLSDADAFKPASGFMTTLPCQGAQQAERIWQASLEREVFEKERLLSEAEALRQSSGIQEQAAVADLYRSLQEAQQAARAASERAEAAQTQLDQKQDVLAKAEAKVSTAQQPSLRSLSMTTKCMVNGRLELATVAMWSVEHGV
jgi:hypothetical protein